MGFQEMEMEVQIIFTLIFMTILSTCKTSNRPKMADYSDSEPYVEPNIHSSNTREFLGHLFPFQSWFTKSKLIKPANINSHDQLTNREKWLDYFKANPIVYIQEKYTTFIMRPKKLVWMFQNSAFLTMETILMSKGQMRRPIRKI